MLEKKALRRKFLLRVLTSKSALLPATGGLAALCITWAMSSGVGMVLSAVAAGIGFGIGAIRYGVKDENIASAVLEELVKEERVAEKAGLDERDERFSSDRDTRDEELLRSLRAVYDAFNIDGVVGKKLDSFAVHDILSNAAQMFWECVNALDEAFEVLQTAKKIKVVEARDKLLLKRERILVEVNESLIKLSEALSRLQSLGDEDGAEKKLVRLRDELDRGLKVASRAEETLRDRLKRIEDRTRDQ